MLRIHFNWRFYRNLSFYIFLLWVVLALIVLRHGDILGGLVFVLAMLAQAGDAFTDWDNHESHLTQSHAKSLKTGESGKFSGK
ncbi:hypothetical protein [Levilactobacillus suantsaii]|uniref:Uncharacterized protein n=1 Tax=Levilactobacillus suantsaii TaxID=2292255 RepID=A0A4Q0VJY8_9LACO|nr:hypothetical protein [Levilactobacillus suantsaii]QMU07817.1 hypothetical protein H3M12_10165 [Levilactobacillus suantsaii]RXI79443.1 hypothetical protein DXH47_03435 [Levilactobacillus suantsaii]